MNRVQIGQLEGSLKRVRLPMGLVIDRIELEGHEAVIDENPIQVHLSSPARIQAFVSEPDLAQFLNDRELSGLRGFSVRLAQGQLFVEASVKVLVEIPGQAVCRLRIHEGRQLWVDLESVEVLGVGAKGLVQSQLEKINPVIDVADLPISVTLREVHVEAGFIRLLADFNSI